ncbi:MAG: type VI secretion system protein TssA [Acidobacteriota bacterium]|nr:type VI secretion system protein TssA [Acidobacteriota bacterium]
MTEVLRKPAVIDLEAILQPISEENPAGENLQYSGLYDEIREARRADQDVAQGEWKIELKVADYRKVIVLAVPALTTRTKDLQIAAWLTESLVNEYGFAGLRDSLKLFSGLQEKFWETLFPEVDEGDMEGRANAVEWMDTQTSLAIKKAAITSGEGYNFLDYEDSKRFDFPENLDTLDLADQQRYKELQEQAETENRVTGNKWRQAKTTSRRAFYEELAVAIGDCWTEYAQLNRIIEEKFDRNQMPGLSRLKKSLDDIDTQVKKLLEEKRVEEPDEEPDETSTDGAPSENGTGATGGAKTSGVATASGAIQSRADALKRLANVAEYFRRNEPHSPVAYLVQRAVKWGDMPLESWLQDVIKDETIIFNLRQTLGLNTNPPDASDTSTQ